MEQVYGIHAVDALLRREPGSIQRLWVQAGRQDKRMAALLDLAVNQGIATQTVPRAELDQKVFGRHQGVVAEVLRESRGGRFASRCPG